MMMMWLLAACSSAPPCKDALDHVAKVDPFHDSEAHAMVGICEHRSWNNDVRNCFAKVASRDDYGRCVAQVAGDVAELMQREAAEAKAAADRAEAAAAQAAKDAADANARLEAIQKQLADVDARVTAAVTAVASATSDAARKQAQATLAAVQADQNALRAQAGATKAAVEHAIRTQGIHVSPRCLDNPLGSGCS
jgi:hypothetical protein